MKATRVLGLCGLLSSALAMIGGLGNMPVLVGLSGAVMLFGNAYAIMRP